MANIQFTDPRKVKTISLPSFEGSEVQVYQNLKIQEKRELQDKHLGEKSLDDAPETLKIGYMIGFAAKAIKDWNFTDENDAKLEISEDILSQFTEDDLIAIIEAATNTDLSNQGSDQKKQ